jgi:hypothetical protein
VTICDKVGRGSGHHVRLSAERHDVIKTLYQADQKNEIGLFLPNQLSF